MGHAMQSCHRVLGCSNHTYTEAIWSQKRPDWFAIHVMN
jgi:hypothetical protein